MAEIDVRNQGTIERLLNQKEVAEILGISTKTIELWRSTCTGPKFVKIGRLARYRESDIREFVESLVSKEIKK